MFETKQNKVIYKYTIPLEEVLIISLTNLLY